MSRLIRPLLLWCLFGFCAPPQLLSRRIQSFGRLLSEVDVVTLYLLQGTNDRLRQKLEKELKSGARVVSPVFTFAGWSSLTAADYNSQIHLYKIGTHRAPT